MSVPGPVGLQLAPETVSVRAARRAVADVIVDAPEDVRDDALLCTSEVVTNAIEHGAPPIDLRVRRDRRRLRVEVRDTSPAEPHVKDPGDEVTRGRGMLIVDRCADRWGIEPGNGDGGKAVWFELDVGGRGRR